MALPEHPTFPGFRGVHPSDPAGLRFQRIGQAEKWFLSLNSEPAGISAVWSPRSSGQLSFPKAKCCSCGDLRGGTSPPELLQVPGTRASCGTAPRNAELAWAGTAPWASGTPRHGPFQLGTSPGGLCLRMGCREGVLPSCPSHKEFWTFWKGFGDELWLLRGCWCDIRVVDEENCCSHVGLDSAIQQRCLSHSWPHGALGVQYLGCDAKNEPSAA